MARVIPPDQMDDWRIQQNAVELNIRTLLQLKSFNQT